MVETVHISRSVLASVLADARADTVNERCGLLLGRGAAITALRPARNVADDAKRQFELDPAMLIACLRDERAGGPAVVGHYHSHPNGAAEPSVVDAAAARDDGRLWLIVTAIAWRAWRSRAGGALHDAFDFVELIETDD